MKVYVDKREVTLTVHGRERTFSEQELVNILEKHFSNESTEQVAMAKVAQVPTEDHWFDVNPQAIDQTLFEKKRIDEKQENTRRLILKAFAEVKSSPKKYGKKFKTMMPKKTWTYKTVAELKQLACELGDHNADWVEQALEWAQRIYNGESWEAVCNNADTANWYRLVVWEDGFAELVGGSRDDNFVIYPASDVSSNAYFSGDKVNSVPLVVLYEE